MLNKWKPENLTEIQRLFKIVHLEVHFNSLGILWELVKVRTDFYFSFLLAQEIHLASQNPNFLVEKINFFMMSV